MAYDISNDSFLAKLRVDLDAEMGPEAFVELREPTKKEFLKLSIASKNGDAEAAEEVFAALLPSLILNHGFIAGGKPASSQQAADAIQKKIPAINKVETAWLEWASAPFLNKTESA